MKEGRNDAGRPVSTLALPNSPGEPPTVVILGGKLFVFAQKRFVKISFLGKQKARFFFFSLRGVCRGFIGGRRAAARAASPPGFHPSVKQISPNVCNLTEKTGDLVGGCEGGNADGVCFHWAVGADSCER